MKKREVIIVILLIAFGVLYNLYEEGDIDIVFFDECTISPTRLHDRHHPVLFPQEEIQRTDIRRIDIENTAGEILVEKSQDNTTTIKPVIQVYHKDRNKAEDIYHKIKIVTRAADGRIDINTESKGKFPYKRVRVQFKLFIPEDVELGLYNRYGDIDIRDAGKDISLNERHGDIRVQNIVSKLKIYHRYGNVNLGHITNTLDLNSQQGKITIKDISALKLNCVHSRVSITGVKDETKIDHASYCTLEVENANKLSIHGRQTRIRLKNIKNGVNIKNSHQTISMNEISGDIKIMTRNCRIRLAKIAAEAFTLKNSHGRVAVEDISGTDLDLAVSNGDLDINFTSVAGRINIKNRHSDILLSYPAGVVPSFNIDLKYGKIINRTSREFSILKEQHRVSFSSAEGKPEIIINDSYGDVILQNFTPKTTQTEIKVETEEFNQQADIDNL